MRSRDWGVVNSEVGKGEHENQTKSGTSTEVENTPVNVPADST